jgi:hypothetical protein
MPDMEFTAQVRAFPSRGRARMNADDLLLIPVKEGEELVVCRTGEEKTIVVTAFADQLVDKGHMRLSKEDLDVIGAAQGDTLYVKRKVPLTETITAGFDSTKEKVGTTLDPHVRKIDASLKGGAAAVSGAVAKIPVPEQITSLVDSAKKKLAPSDAAQLSKVLKDNEGSVRMVEVASGTEMRMLSAIKLPEGILVTAIRRGDEVLIYGPSLAVLGGDTVFIIGKEPGLSEAAKVIGA